MIAARQNTPPSPASKPSGKSASRGPIRSCAACIGTGPQERHLRKRGAVICSATPWVAQHIVRCLHTHEGCGIAGFRHVGMHHARLAAESRRDCARSRRRIHLEFRVISRRIVGHLRTQHTMSYRRVAAIQVSRYAGSASPGNVPLVSATSTSASLSVTGRWFAFMLSCSPAGYCHRLISLSSTSACLRSTRRWRQPGRGAACGVRLRRHLRRFPDHRRPAGRSVRPASGLPDRHGRLPRHQCVLRPCDDAAATRRSAACCKASPRR